MATSTSLPDTMKAAQWNSMKGKGLEDSLGVTTTAPLPKHAASLPKDHTLVEIAYCSLNPVDFKFPEIPVMNRIMFCKPAIPCHAYSGTVANTTRTDLKPGDRVFGTTDIPVFGTAAGYAIAGKDGCVLVPEGVQLDQAASIGCAGLTSYQCIVPFVKTGDKVLINGGSGGSGTFGIQFAKALGCYVTAICSGPNVELCRSLGADEVLDYRTVPIVPALKKAGTQYDLIVDNVFADHALYYQAHHYTTPAARYVNVGGPMNFGQMGNLLKMSMCPGWAGGGKRKFQFLAVKTDHDEHAKIAAWMKEGKVKAVIEEVYPLEKISDAFARLKTGRVRGKLVVKI